jgi:hypothetical protein
MPSREVSADGFSVGAPNAGTACASSVRIGAISAISATRFGFCVVLSVAKDLIAVASGKALQMAMRSFASLRMTDKSGLGPRVVLSAAKDLIAGASGEALQMAMRSLRLRSGQAFATLRITEGGATRFGAGVVLTNMADPHRMVGRNTPQHCAWLSSESVGHNGLWRGGILSHRYIGSKEVTALHALRRCRSVP